MSRQRLIDRVPDIWLRLDRDLKMLERFFGVIDWEYDRVHDKIGELFSLRNVDLIPDKYLHLLAPLVGHIWRTDKTHLWNRRIRNAIRRWSYKGTVASIADLVAEHGNGNFELIDMASKLLVWSKQGHWSQEDCHFESADYFHEGDFILCVDQGIDLTALKEDLIETVMAGTQWYFRIRSGEAGVSRVAGESAGITLCAGTNAFAYGWGRGEWNGSLWWTRPGQRGSQTAAASSSDAGVDACEGESASDTLGSLLFDGGDAATAAWDHEFDGGGSDIPDGIPLIFDGGGPNTVLWDHKFDGGGPSSFHARRFDGGEATTQFLSRRFQGGDPMSFVPRLLDGGTAGTAAWLHEYDGGGPVQEYETELNGGAGEQANEQEQRGYYLYVDARNDLRGYDLPKSQASCIALDRSLFDGMTFQGSDGVTHTWNVGYEWAAQLTTQKQLWPYFRLCKVVDEATGIIDLYDAAGKVTQLYSDLTTALELCVVQGWPGILFDPEMYLGNGGNHAVYAVARDTGLTQAQVQQQCQWIGAGIADVIAATFPAATIWMIMPVLYDPWWTYYWFHVGLLTRAAELSLPGLMIDGGEMPIGYVFANRDDFIDRMFSHDDSLAQMQSTFPQLRLGAPMTLWMDATETSGWVRSNIDSHGAGYPFQKLDDLHPVALAAFRNRKHAWLYNEGITAFDPIGGDQRAHDAFIRRVRMV